MSTEMGAAAIRAKGKAYLILTLVMIITSALSIIFIYHYFSDKNLFLSLDFLTISVLVKICVLLVCYFLLDTLRFFYILKTLKMNIPFLYMIKLAFINIFVSNITPFATGGGFAQVYFLSKKKVPVGGAAAASTIRSLLAILFFFIASPFVLASNRTFLNLFPENQSFLTIGILVVIYVFLVYCMIKLIRKIKIAKAIVFRIFRFFQKKKIISHRRRRKITLWLFKEMESFSAGFYMFMKGGKKYILLSIVFTLLFLLSLFLFPVILVGAMDYHIPSIVIIKMQVIITFITYLAFTPGATGIAEGGFALLFSDIISGKDIVTLTLSWRFFSIYIGVIIGLLIFYMEVIRTSRNERLRKLKETTES